jgi:hypothetical protein
VPYPVEELGRATGRALRSALGTAASRRAVGVDPTEGEAPPLGTVPVGRLVVRGSTAPPAGN